MTRVYLCSKCKYFIGIWSTGKGPDFILMNYDHYHTEVTLMNSNAKLLVGDDKCG